MEVEESEEEVEENEEDQEKLEGGKRRKVVRRGRFFRAGESFDMERLILFLENLSSDNKARCMRSLGGSRRPLGESGTCSDASESKRDKTAVHAQKKFDTQEDSMDTPSV